MDGGILEEVVGTEAGVVGWRMEGEREGVNSEFVREGKKEVVWMQEQETSRGGGVKMR